MANDILNEAADIRARRNDPDYERTLRHRPKHYETVDSERAREDRILAQAAAIHDQRTKERA